VRLNNILISLVLLGMFSLFGITANAAPKEQVADAQELVQGPKEIRNDVPLNREERIVLSPFFQLRRKGSKIGIERIIVTLLMAMPTDCVKYDFNNPTFRKMFYDLLQSEKQESYIQSQFVANLSRQLKLDIDAAVQVSRSFIIVY
jgi:hypothetical protein